MGVRSGLLLPLEINGKNGIYFRYERYRGCSYSYMSGRGFFFLGEGVIRRWRMSGERGVQTAKGASEDDAWA